MHTIQERFTLYKKILDEITLLIANYYHVCETYEQYEKLYDVIEELVYTYDEKFRIVRFGISKVDNKCSVENLELTFTFFMANYEKNRGLKKEFSHEIEIKSIFRKIKLDLLMQNLYYD